MSRTGGAHTHLISFKDDDYVCKVATTKEDRRKLIENGFTFVAKEVEEWYFRKRK